MTLKPFKPLLVTVVWSDPKSTFENYNLDDVINGKGCGVQRNRQTVGFLCYVSEEYVEIYSDYDEEDAEVGGGTAIFNVLIHKIKMFNRGIIFCRRG